jgi:hypothetical protein
MGFRASLTFPKGACIIQHPFAILLCPVWLRKSVHTLEDNSQRICTSIWTMHVRTIQTRPANIFAPGRSNRCFTRLAVQIKRHLTSSLVIWEKPTEYDIPDVEKAAWSGQGWTNQYIHIYILTYFRQSRPWFKCNRGKWSVQRKARIT